MKKLLYVLVALLVFSACKKDKKEEVKPVEKPTIIGTWDLISFEIKNGEETVDAGDFPNRNFMQFFQDGRVYHVVLDKKGEVDIADPDGRYTLNSDTLKLSGLSSFDGFTDMTISFKDKDQMTFGLLLEDNYTGSFQLRKTDRDLEKDIEEYQSQD